MAARDVQAILMPSVLDRLIDPESGVAGRNPSHAADRIVNAVRRDLEDLLNTHQSQGDLPAEYVELTNSVFTYGLPDPPMLTEVALERSQEVGRILETLIRRFETRLQDVRVRLVDPGEVRHGRMRFHIEARMDLEPSPEIGFETVVELSTGHASVKSSGA